jgi:hypothetical protein
VDTSVHRNIKTVPSSVDNTAMHLSAKSSALTILLAEVAAESALHPEVAGLQRDGCIRGPAPLDEQFQGVTRGRRRRDKRRANRGGG